MSAGPFDFEDLGPPPHDAHVKVFYGFDLTSADALFRPEMAACPFCDALSPGQTEDELLLAEEEWGGRFRHFVCCGTCGTRGPVGKTESAAVAAWNVVGGGWHPLGRRLSACVTI